MSSSTADGNGLMAITKEEGVKDLLPMKVRANFARALLAEREAGHTTPEAEQYLDLAVAEEASA